MMGTSVLRVGIVGCGRAARIHLDRLLALPAGRRRRLRRSRPQPAPQRAGREDQGAVGAGSARAFTDHRELSAAAGARCPLHLHAPSLALPAGDGCPPGRLPRVHREAAIDQFAGGGRHRGAGPGTGPSRSRWGTSTASARASWRPGGGSSKGRSADSGWSLPPWHGPGSPRSKAPDEDWRLDRKVAGGGILADAGDHLIDALLWTTGRAARKFTPSRTNLELGARPGHRRGDPAERRDPGDPGRLRASRRVRSSS